jgi:predicted negative regulator of RcsB-dependent stress response
MEWMYGGGRDPNGRGLDEEIQIADDMWKERVSMAEGGTPQLVQPGPGRQGYGGSPVYTINEENFKLLDDLIPNTELTINEIKVKLGGNEKSGNQGVNKLIEAWEASDKDRVVPEKRFRPYKMGDTEFSQKIIDATKDAKYIKEDGTPNIKRLAKDFFPEKNLDDARKAVRGVLETGIDYEGKTNVPGEITAAKQSKKNARENIKIAQEKAGIKTTKQADQVIDKILSQNEIYQKMSVEDIAKDKDFLKRLRVQIDSATGDVTFDGYTKKSPVRGKIFTDLELAQHAKDKAMKYELFAPDHITPKALRKQNVGYPINFQPATYMENSHFDNARKYLQANPDGNIQAIDNYLASNNQTIRFGENAKYKFGFKLPIKFNPETGTSNIVESSFKKTIPKFKPKISGGQAFHSFPANLPKMWKMMGSGTRKMLGWMTAGYTEKLFYDWDKKNEMSKGKTEEEAAGIALNNASFGIIPNKKYLPELKKIAEDMGINPQAFEKVYFLNEQMVDVQKQDAQYQQRIEMIKKMPGDPERKARALADMEEAYANWQKGMTPEIEKWSEDVAGQIAISKTKLPKPSLDQIAEERYNITDEDWMKPFAEIQMVGEEKLRREKDRAYDVQSKLADPESGSGYKWVTNWFTPSENFFDLRTTGQEKQRLIDDMVRFDPKELYRYNLYERGISPDSPVSKEARENLEYEQPGLGLGQAKGGRVSYLDGGIASLKKK